eukprot:SAG11_NODE_5372_length_1580_cov_2.704929_1_plen_108_part_00
MSPPPPLLLLLLLLLASAAAACRGSPRADAWPAAGVWNDSLPDLPQTSAGNLPHSPMLGNGYLGVMLATNRLEASISRNGTRRPAAPAGNSSSDSLHLWLGSNGGST